MLQSVLRGRKTEIDYLNGEIVRLAQQVGEEAPVNATLVEAVHSVEETGKFVGVSDLASRVGQASSFK
jgi:2-dehydropantoate 2-reductase